jgi:hypothetical protein
MVVAILGMFLNDSGAAIPGMMMALAFPAAMLLISEMKVEISQEKQSNTTLNSESV